MVRVTSTKAMRNSGAGLVRSVGKSDMRGTKAKPSALRRLAQGSKVEKKGSAAKSRKTSPTPKAKRVSSSDSGDAVSDSSRDSRQSSGSEGLDCLCNAVQLELSNGGDDTIGGEEDFAFSALTPLLLVSVFSTFPGLGAFWVSACSFTIMTKNDFLRLLHYGADD